LISGLRGGRSLEARVQGVCIGVASTMLLNLLRVAAVAAIIAVIGVTPAILFHDHGGTLLVIVFLFAFWLFLQRWILEPQSPGELEVSA
jgi:exosortase/archaeosortase family protein